MVEQSIVNRIHKCSYKECQESFSYLPALRSHERAHERRGDKKLDNQTKTEYKVPQQLGSFRGSINRKVELGLEVEDIITGFKGIVVSVSDFLYGCRRIQVVRKITEKDTNFDEQSLSMMFDEPQLKVIGNGVVQPEINLSESVKLTDKKPKSTGGSRSFMPSHH